MISEVKIGPLDFSIVLQDEITGHEDDGTPVPIMGMCCICERIIYISRVPDIQMQYKYLVHEILEAYKSLYDLAIDHPTLIQLETIFFDMVLSNPQLTQEIENNG